MKALVRAVIPNDGGLLCDDAATTAVAAGLRDLMGLCADEGSFAWVPVATTVASVAPQPVEGVRDPMRAHDLFHEFITRVVRRFSAVGPRRSVDDAFYPQKLFTVLAKCFLLLPSDETRTLRLLDGDVAVLRELMTELLLRGLTVNQSLRLFLISSFFSSRLWHFHSLGRSGPG